MFSYRVLVITCLAGLVVGCYHPLEIYGEGDIGSASGSRDCSLDDYNAGALNCSENLVYDAYSETYTALPKANYQFRRWGNYCQRELDNTCSFNMSQNAVDSFQGHTFPALQAIFRDTFDTGLNTLFIGNEHLIPFTGNLDTLAATVNYLDHDTGTFFASGLDGLPQALWDDESGSRADIQLALNTSDVELLGFAYSPTAPSMDSYRLWIDYALSQNPDTRFFVAAPWGDDPGSMSAAGFAAEMDDLHQQVHALLDALRTKYPGVDFYCVPLGEAAAELYSLYDASALPDVSALVGASATALFTGSPGGPGDILASVGELVALGLVYDIDPAAHPTDPGYLTDLRALAGQIVAEHDAQYNAPDEIDVDSDGDGIVDRLDPNPLNRPNILLIMVDDMGYNDLAINNGNTDIHTPNLDAFAAQGMRFTRHYAAASCSPARAALLTGLHPERVGYQSKGLGISPQLETISERLQREDYSTWHIGKWHAGHLDRGSWPDRQGFDHWLGFLIHSYLSGNKVDGELVPGVPTYLDPWLQGDTEPGAFYPGHLEDILTDHALATLEQLEAAGDPWFVNLWTFAPHEPVQPSAIFAAMYPDTDAGSYQAVVHQLDYNIGRVLDRLDQLGAADDTIVVVVSDNGGTNNYLDNNYPFSGQKPQQNEGGLRTPLLIRWPDSLLNEQVYNQAVSIMDLYPTLMAAAGVEVPQQLDGVNLLPYLENQQPLPDRELFWNSIVTSYGALDTAGRYRYFQNFPFFGIPTAPKLFDLQLDPTGTQYVEPMPQEIQAAFLASYEVWYRDVHVVATDYEPDVYSGGVLRGMDFQRAPGHSRYTFGIGVDAAYEGPIAQQAGIWQMSRTGTTVSLNLGPANLSGDMPATSGCHSVVYSGNFFRRDFWWNGPDKVIVTLYIDGVAVDTADVAGVLETPDTSMVTVIGDPDAVGPTPPLTPPVILNTSFVDPFPWSAASFSQEVCNP